MVKALYLHVPFCDTICAYCDFARCKTHPQLVEAWLNAIEKEINEKKMNQELRSIYIGGGTPTALNVEQLTRLLCMLEPYTQHVKEYTLEANIENLDEAKLKVMKQFKINRISLGVQSFNERLLKIIERHHTQKQVEDMIYLIDKIGIHNISIDLIYALPTQSMEEWEEDLRIACTHPKISHVSLYSLTIEEHSKFAREHVQATDNELEGKMFDKAMAICKEAGFNHYEISNFARSNAESIHNQCYWDYEDFYGLGSGASGKENHVRYTHAFTLDKYLKGIDEIEKVQLSLQEEAFERIMMGLRMKRGIDIHLYHQQYGIDLTLEYKTVIEQFITKKWLLLSNNHLCPTELGMSFLNEILLAFMN